MRRTLAILGIVLVAVLVAWALSRRIAQTRLPASAQVDGSASTSFIEPSPPAPFIGPPREPQTALPSTGQRSRAMEDGGVAPSFDYDEEKNVTIEWPGDSGRPRIHRGDRRRD